MKISVLVLLALALAACSLSSLAPTNVATLQSTSSHPIQGTDAYVAPESSATSVMPTAMQTLITEHPIIAEQAAQDKTGDR